MGFLDEWYDRGGPDYHEVVVEERRRKMREEKKKYGYVKPKDRKVLCPDCKTNMKGAEAARCQPCHVRYMHKVRDWPKRG